MASVADVLMFLENIGNRINTNSWLAEGPYCFVLSFS
jgi:hypothetical protein